MGIFRRTIRISGRPGEMRAELEDDYHRFAVDLSHDGERVLAVRGEAIRTPYDTCWLAPGALGVLEGLPLQPYASDFVRLSNSRAQCTHMYELAALAGSHALRQAFAVTYAAEAFYPLGEEPTPVTLYRDGHVLLDWQVRRPPASGVDGLSPERLVAGDEIVSPEPYAGRPIRGLVAWARATLSPEMFDAVWLFRRAIQISSARVMDLDAPGVDMVDLLFSRKTGDCFTFQAANRQTTHRQRGSTLDFTSRPDGLLKDLS